MTRRASPLRSLGSTCALALSFAVTGCGDDSSGGGGAGASPGTGGESQGGSPATGGNGGASGGGGGQGQGGGGGGAEPTGTPVFVAVGYGGRRMSSFDGVTWENDVIVDPNGGDDNTLFRGVGYGDGVFVAVGGSSEGQIATSTDAATWTAQSPGSSWLGDVVYLDGVFIAAGGNGLRQRSADKAVTWTNQAPYYAGHFRAIAAGNGLAVAAGHTYGTDPNVGLTSFTSDAGLTWSPEATGGPAFGSVAFGAGMFVAVGQDGCRASADAETWVDCGIASGGLDRVVFANGEFLVPDGAGYHRSTNGTVWSHDDAPARGVQTFGFGLYLATSWPDRIETSVDLTSFAVVNDGTGPAFTQIELGFVTP